MTGSKTVPWVAFVLGAVASVAANVAHAAERAEHVGVGGMLAAGWAPVALLLVAEMVTRSRTRGPWWSVAARWTGTGIVATVAAVVSFGHMRDLLLSYGESPLVAHLLPLSVDGLVLVASVALATPAPNSKSCQPNADVLTVEDVRPVEEEQRNGDSVEDVKAQPEPVPAPESSTPVEDVRAQARDWARSVEATGKRLTGRDVGDRFGKTDRWGRDRLREARNLVAAAAS